MTKVSNTKKFATTDHTASPYSIKEAWIWTWVRWTLNFGTLGKMNLNFGTLVHHLWSAGFLNKAAIPCPNTSSFYLLSCGAVSSTSLDSVTPGREAFAARKEALARATASRSSFWKTSLSAKCLLWDQYMKFLCRKTLNVAVLVSRIITMKRISFLFSTHHLRAEWRPKTFHYNPLWGEKKYFSSGNLVILEVHSGWNLTDHK